MPVQSTGETGLEESSTLGGCRTDPVTGARVDNRYFSQVVLGEQPYSVVRPRGNQLSGGATVSREVQGEARTRGLRSRGSYRPDISDHRDPTDKLDVDDFINVLTVKAVNEFRREII